MTAEDIPKGFNSWKEAAIAERARRVSDITILDKRLLVHAQCLQSIMARLADLLDDDQFSNIESMVLACGVTYPKVQIGEFTICHQDADKIWISSGGGEGGEFKEALLADVIRKFYSEHF